MGCFNGGNVMLKLENIKVSYKLTAIIAVAIVGLLSLLFIATSALRSNLVVEREARLNAVIDTLLSQISHLQKTLPE
ncbi:MAG: chemotaxis protein, partial [Vibrio sp.]|nr:chemotaxis protein [Vibrio sp.]